VPWGFGVTGQPCCVRAAASRRPGAGGTAAIAGGPCFVASAFIQRLTVRARQIYSWSSPLESFVCLIIYVLLWATDYLLGGALLFLIYLVLARRFNPPDVDDLRESVQRSEDPEQTAFDLNELIEQHGLTGWADILFKRFGELMVLQLSDTANTLEVVWNFYEWREPACTAFSLSIIVLLWATVTFIPIYWIIKCASAFGGLMFFAISPFQMLHPEYRLLVSPLTWLFWNVPTNFEWAISRLQAEAMNKKAGFLREVSEDSAKDLAPELAKNQKVHSYDVPFERMHANDMKLKPPYLDYGIFPGKHDGTAGKFIISATGVRFTPTAHSVRPDGEEWILEYSQMDTLEKVSKKVKLRADNQEIVLKDVRGREYKITGLDSKDEPFSQILGYSGLRWHKLE